MAGLSHLGGPLVDGWAHVEQSIADILRTPVGARVMRREYGSRLPDLVDALPTDRTLLALWVAVADALEKWEPRFSVERIGLASLDPAEMAGGRIVLEMVGTYYPRGHLGDRTTAIPERSLDIALI